MWSVSEHCRDPVRLGGEGVVRLLGPRRRTDAQRLDDDRPVAYRVEERNDGTKAERGAKKPRDEHEGLAAAGRLH
jgi:hypothetical protein